MANRSGDHERAKDPTSVVSRSESLDRMLDELVLAAAAVIPHSIGVTVSLWAGQGLITAASSSQQGRALDKAQYDSGEGPCVAASETGQLVEIPDVGQDRRWPSVLARAQELGVGSVLTEPLLIGGQPAGALNMSSDREAGFTDQRIRALAATLRDLGSALLQTAHNEAERRREEAARLQRAIVERDVLRRAEGVIMAGRGGSAEQAFAELRRTTGDEPIHQTAREILSKIATPPPTEPGG
jgi:GAF domain-containing protein